MLRHAHAPRMPSRVQAGAPPVRVPPRPTITVRVSAASLYRCRTPSMMQFVPRAAFATEKLYSGSRKKNIGVPTLKGQLKRFYKLIHPDLFAAHPDARAANETALTQLMAVADKLNKHPGGNPFKPTETHRFVFYVMKREGQNKVTVQQDNEGGGRVAVNEVEGQPLLQVHFETKINAPYEETRAAFAKLFSTMGIDPDFVLDEPDERVFPPSIEEFFNQYGEYARNKKTTFETHQKEELELVKEVEQKTGGQVVDLPDATPLPLEDRLRVLQSFLEVFPKMVCSHLLHGQYIAFQAPFTGSYYDREREAVCFDPLADPMQWATFVDLKLSLPEYALYLRPKEKDQKRAAASFLDRMERLKRKHSEVGGAKRKEKTPEQRATEKQEKQLASLLGLKSISFPRRDESSVDDEQEEFDDDEEGSESVTSELIAYRAFLDRLLKPVPLQEMQKWMTLNAKRAKAFKNVSLRIREFTLPKRWSVASDGGLFVTSTIDRPAELISILEEAGPQALSAVAETRKRDELRNFLRARMGLHSVHTHRTVFATEKEPAVKVRSALERLVKNADELRELNVRGHMLVISHKYAIADNGQLFVPWNFQFESKAPKRISKPEEEEKNSDNNKST